MGIVNYIRETRAELKHVTWPTRQQAIMFTIMVIVVCVVVSFFLGFFDYLFNFLIQKFIV